MNKVERRRREQATVYRVFKPFTSIGDVHTVLKIVRGNVDGSCDVTLKFDPGVKTPRVIWCSCMGFRGQKFPHIEHKHVRIVLDYLSRGEPKDAEYRLSGTGRSTRITYTGKLA